MKKIKVLNLYAGIGGNSKLWPDDEIEVTAVEYDKEIADVYQDFFPDDTVIVADAHQYLLEHYIEFDFIWSSPPCPTHGQLRFRTRVLGNKSKAVYPDMKLYEEIILLQHHFKGKWVVENVEPYYEPLIKPQKLQRHYFWANFRMIKKRFPASNVSRAGIKELQEYLSIDLSNTNIVNKRLVLRNCVNPKLGLHVWNCAFKEKQQRLL